MKYLIMIMLILSTTVANAKTYPVIAPDYQDSFIYGLQTEDSSGNSYFSSIVIKAYDSRDALDVAWEATGNTGKVDAFTNWEMKGESDIVCVIHIIQPKDWNDVQIQADLGHEVLHCFGADHMGD